MPRLLLGPLLRYADETSATVWVETDRPARVEVLGCGATTFAIAGHHYAVVPVTGLRPGEATPYEVVVDGQRAWPDDDSMPAPALRTRDPRRPLRILLASCRRAGAIDDPRLGPDALALLAARLLVTPPQTWPDLLLFVGDQVYADKLSPGYLAWLRARRDLGSGPRAQAATFEEYSALYTEAWSPPLVRWLLSTVPSAMLLDDHEVSGGWFLSQAWLEKRERTGWWPGKYAAALASYWVHQHLGNLAPDALAAEPLLDEVRGATHGDRVLLGAVLADPPDWSYERELGPARLVALEGRIHRALMPGARTMHDPRRLGRLQGDVSHLLVVTPLPVLLAPAIAYGEAWSEAADSGALAAVAEALRRMLDLEHWPAFDASMRAMLDAVASVASGGRGIPPASVLWLSGDVHHGYLAEARFPDLGSAQRSAVWQLVSSPLRNPMRTPTRVMTRLGATRPVTTLTRAMARSARVAPWPVDWHLTDGLLYGNQLATLELTEQRIDVTLEVARPGGGLVPVIRRRVTPSDRACC